MQPERLAEMEPTREARMGDAQPPGPALNLALNEAHLLLDQASAAEGRGDREAALALLLAAIDRDPATEPAYARAGALHRAAGRPQEAEAILLEGMCWFPSGLGLFAEYAALADDRQDWAQAVRRYRLARERFPSAGWTHGRLIAALRHAGRPDEAEQAALDGERQLPHDLHFPLEHAEIAAERGDLPEAARRFGQARRRFPASWWPYRREADMLRRSGAVAAAEAVLLEGQDMVPDEPALAQDHAELAFERRDWAEAVRRYGLMRDRFPALWWPFKRIAEALAELDRIGEAEEVLREGQGLFPDEAAMVFDYADLARRARRHEEALARFQLVRQRFPDNHWGYLVVSRALATVGRHREAGTILTDMARAFPDEPGAVIELAYLSGRMPAEARPVPLPALVDMVDAQMGRNGETLDLLLARAHLAQLRHDYADQMRQLVLIAERHPDAADVKALMFGAREVLLGLGQAIPGEEDPSAGHGDMPRTPQELVGWFESLGGGGPGGSRTLGCEFGFLQRELRIEPLSLLRWIGVSLPNVTRLLERDFEGIGDPEMMTVTATDPFWDWCVVDTSYGLHCDHSHLDRLSVPQEDARRMMCERSRFLARKLREDLEDGEKIFVYRYAGRLEDEADMLALGRAVNGYGDNTLLFVCRADERHAPGTVREVHPGLLVGHIDWFTLDRPDYPVNVDGWMTICEAAFRLWRDRRAAA